ncbi:exported hypothetical protein [Candidatus Magnetomoraceae bacterium gMMP-1]
MNNLKKFTVTLFIFLFVFSINAQAEIRPVIQKENSFTVVSVAIDPTGRYIVSGSGDKTVKLWNLNTGRLIKTLTGHSSYVWSAAIDPTGRYIVSGSWGNTLKLWNLNTGKLIKTLNGHSVIGLGQ